MKKYIVNGKPVKAKSILDAVKKVKDKIINAEARNSEDLKKIIQSWTDRDDGIKVRVWLSKNTYSDIYYYHDVNGYYVIPTGVASTTTEYTHDRAKETALKYANKIFDSKSVKDRTYVKPTGGWFYGIYGMEFIWNGNADPYIKYKGRTVNYYDVEDALYEDYKEDVKYNDYKGEFEKWVKENANMAKYYAENAPQVRTKDSKVKDSKYEFDGSQFDIDELKEDAARYGLDVLWAGYGKTYFVKGQKEDISKLLQEYNMPKEVVNIKDANPLVQEVANAIKGINEIFSYKMQKALENKGFDVSYDESSNLGYILYAKKNGKKIAIISKNQADPDADDIVQGNYVIGLMDSIKDAKTKYWFCPDDSYGQHGTDYFEVMLTEKEAAEIKKTRIYNGQKGFLTNSLTAMSYYVNDSKTCKDAWVNEETKNFFTGGDKPNFDKARKLSKSIGEFWMARSSGVFLGERSQLDKLEKLLRENNIPFKRLEPPKLIIEDSKTCKDESTKEKLIKLWAYIYGQSKAEAKKHIDTLSDKEIEEKYKLLNQGFNANAKKAFYEDSAIKDAYYNIGGYKSKDDKMLKQDIAKAKSYGLTTYLEWIDGSYQLTVEGSYDKVKKIVEDYFGLDVSSIGDSKCKDATISYKGYDIEFNFYGKKEYTVQYQGDDIWFKTIDEAKKFIDEITLKKDSKSCKDMPYNGTSQVKEINKGYAIVLRSRWEKYGVNAGIETWEPSLDGAKAHKDSLTRADGLAFVIIDCNTKQVIDSKCKDAVEKVENVGKFTLWKDDEGYYYLDATISRSGKRLRRLNTKDINEAKNKVKEMLSFIEDESPEELVKRYQKRVDTAIESFGRIGGALYDELDDNGLYVKEENGKYIVKKKVQDSVKDESMFMILNKDEGCYLYNVDISSATYSLTNNANKADKFTLNEANRIINILKKYNFDNLTTSEFLDSKCKDVNPNEGESKEDFISRFMSETKEEYPDEKQRYAVANSYWERRNK